MNKRNAGGIEKQVVWRKRIKIEKEQVNNICNYLTDGKYSDIASSSKRRTQKKKKRIDEEDVIDIKKSPPSPGLEPYENTRFYETSTTFASQWIITQEELNQLAAHVQAEYKEKQLKDRLREEYETQHHQKEKDVNHLTKVIQSSRKALSSLMELLDKTKPPSIKTEEQYPLQTTTITTPPITATIEQQPTIKETPINNPVVATNLPPFTKSPLVSATVANVPPSNHPIISPDSSSTTNNSSNSVNPPPPHSSNNQSSLSNNQSMPSNLPDHSSTPYYPPSSSATSHASANMMLNNSPPPPPQQQQSRHYHNHSRYQQPPPPPHHHNPPNMCAPPIVPYIPPVHHYHNPYPQFPYIHNNDRQRRKR